MHTPPRLAAVLVVLTLLAGCGVLASERPLRIMVPNSAGGGYDVMTRIAAHVLAEERITAAPQVFNLVGGGGTVALSRLLHESGNPDLVMTMGLGVVGASITGGGTARVTGGTPIARLVEEPEGVIVRAGSPYGTIHDLMKAWRAAPGALRVGGGSLPGGPDFLMAMRLAQVGGVAPADVTYMTHDGGGELLPALLSGSVDVAISGVREYTEQIRSGQLHLLAVSGAKRLSTVDAPTLNEAGYDLVFNNWRGILAPPGITDAQRDERIATFTALHDAAGWRDELARNSWTDAFLTGDAFGEFLVEQDAAVQDDLRELGVA